jgi:lysophospholipase L1-like esterase
MTSGPIIYVALGDSTGVGVGAKDGGGYVARLFKRLEAKKPRSRLENLCVSGATTEDLIRGQLEKGVALHPDLVTVGIGINDIGHGLTVEQFAKNYDQILSTLKKTKATIVVTNIPDISTAPQIPSSMRSEYQRRIDTFCKRLEEIAEKHGVTVFDVYTITKQELPSHPEYFSADGFHPSDQGYELWASQMWPTVAQAVGVAE